jgi:DNA-binding CsgD family transcriptional regulator
MTEPPHVRKDRPLRLDRGKKIEIDCTLAFPLGDDMDIFMQGFSILCFDTTFRLIQGNLEKLAEGLSSPDRLMKQHPECATDIPIRLRGNAKMDGAESASYFDEDFWSQEAEFSGDEFIFVKCAGSGQLVSQDLTQSGSFNLTDMRDASVGRFLRTIPVDAFLVDEGRSIAFVNNSLAEKMDEGLELVGQAFSSVFVHPPHADQAGALLEQTLTQRRSWIIEAAIQINTEKSFQRLHLRPIRVMSGRFVLVMMVDLTAAKVQGALISAIKMTEEELRATNEKLAQYSQSLEAKVRERTKHLEDSRMEIQGTAAKLEQANDALKVLIAGIEEQKKSVEKKISENIQMAAKPILDQLKVEDLPDRIRSLVDSLEKSLEDIACSLGSNVARYGHLLTLREIRICEMIKSGLTSKEIAKAMGVSPQTIFFHRSNIRKKLGLTGNSDDLANCLKSMN